MSGKVAPAFVVNDYFCENWNPGPSIAQVLYSRWPTLGQPVVWIPSLLWVELSIWGDRPLVLQAAAPGHNWWHQSSHLWEWTYFKWRYSSWTCWTRHPL